MSAKNDGGPAFPQNDLSGYDMGPHPTGNNGGMSLRDWFAGKALAGMVVGCSGYLGRDKDGSPHFSAYAKGACNAVLADRAYVLADVMLARRATPTKED